jgi:thioester reductase-like protein
MHVLLTGATGVVGDALLPRLLAGGSEVSCLVHRSPLPVPGARTLRGDVRRPHLGLRLSAWRELVARVDAVVHAAAVTDFAGTDEGITTTNVDGTRHVLELAAAAGVPLYHVSTAYRHAAGDGQRGRRAARYAASKRAGERLVLTSGLPTTVFRPSIVVGDSRTGRTSAFQGLHRVAGAVLDGVVPMMPFDPAWPMDVVARDVVADAVATTVEQGRSDGEVWLTSGDRAPRLGEALDVVLEVGNEFGVRPARPRFVPPELFDRLIAPVFLPALPPDTRRTVTGLLEYFSCYLALREPLPSSLPLAGTVPADPLGALRQSLRYWAQLTLPGGAAGEEVA